MTQRMELKEAEIVQSRWQTRRDGYAGESFEGLVSSIKRHGIINPLGAFVNENEEFELVYGHRRLMAARKAGRKTIPVDVIGSLLQGEVQEQLDKFQEMVLVDNLFHEDLTAIEVAEGLQGLIDQQGLTQEQAAKVIGKSQQWVSDKLALLKCAPQVQKAVTERAVEETVAKKLATLPEDVQGPVLERVKGHTSREAGPIVEQIKEALEPGFWDLPKDEPWSPEDINIEAMISDCLEQVRTLTPDKMGEVLDNLRVNGCLRPPAEQYSHLMSAFPRACGLEEQALSDWLKEHGRTCETCLWAGEGTYWLCGQEDTETCGEYLSEDDPVRLPVPCGETDEECKACQEDPGWCEDLGCYILKIKASKEQQKEIRDEESLERAIAAEERLRKFYDAQLEEGVERDHWLAQGCEYCAHWRGPEARDPCDSDRAEQIHTAFWQSDGVTVPWCSEFAPRNLKRIPEIDQACFEEIILGWLEASWGNIAFLPYAQDEMLGVIKDANLNKKQLLALVTYAANPELRDWGEELILMDVVTGEEAKWTRVTEEATTPESG